MHHQRYCDIGRLIRSQWLLNTVGQRIAEAYSDSGAGIVATVSPVDQLLAEVIAAQLVVMGGRSVTVRSLNGVQVPENDGDGILVVDTFCDETADTRKRLMALRRQRLVVGACSAVATSAVNAILLGVPKFVTSYTLDGAMFEAWTCARTGFCSREIPVVTGAGGGDAYVQEYPYRPVVKLSAVVGARTATVVGE